MIAIGGVSDFDKFHKASDEIPQAFTGCFVGKVAVLFEHRSGVGDKHASGRPVPRSKRPQHGQPIVLRQDGAERIAFGVFPASPDVVEGLMASQL